MPELDITTIHEQIEADRKAYAEETYVGGDSIEKFRKYYKGDQPNTYSKTQQAILQGIDVNNSSDNVSAQIVDEGASRLTLLMPSVEGAEGETPEASAEAVRQWIETEIWVKNHLPKLADKTHRSAIRDKDFCLLPFWKAPDRPGQQGRILIYEEPWWDGSSGLFIQYDLRGQMTYAVKEWKQSVEGHKVSLRLVWAEDAIYRYMSASGGAGNWEPYNRADDPLIDGVRAWPIPWLKADGSPLHIPYAHFRCDKSALAGGVLGQQDKLNDQGISIAATVRMTAFQMLHVIGATTPVGGWKVGPSIVMELSHDSENHATTTGVYPAGDISQMLSARDSHLQRIATTSRTPIHAFGAQPWTGDALLRSELPSVNEALARSEQFKPSWATLFHRAVEIANAFGKVDLNEDALIIANYDSVDKLDNLKKFMGTQALFGAAQAAVQAGVPLITFMRKYSGWSEAELAQLESDMHAQEQQAQDAEDANIQRMIDQAAAEAKIARQNAA